MPSAEAQQLATILRAMPRSEKPTIKGSRRVLEGLVRMFPSPADVRVDALSLGGVPAERVACAGADPRRAIFYLHGGGFCMGSPLTHRELGSRISRASGAPAWLPDYRLAPEHPFPAGLDDIVVAWRALLADDLDPRRVVIAGDSAGGGLTISTLVALRDEGLPLPAAAVCLSPWADLTLTSPSITERAGADPWIGKIGLDMAVAAYLGDHDRRDPRASPVLADLRGLPPLLVQVGTAEVLYDDAASLAAAAQDAGVSVTFEPWPDMVHVWQMFPTLPEAHTAVARIAAFVREQTAA